jgi:uroporphyrinogen-III decarboxylase
LRPHAIWSAAALRCRATSILRALFASPETLRSETLRVLDSFGAGPGHVFNLGHGITPDVDPERVAVLVETVRDYILS